MASTGAWFETVAEAHRRAKKRLPKSVYMALVAGSEKGLTLDDNLKAFGELGFAPHVAELPNERDLSTEVMGQPLSMPVMVSPTGVQAVHPDGEVAVYAGGGVGLATGGSGDVLAGLIAGLVARGLPGWEAACWGVWLHGEAGRRLAERMGPVGFLARELAAEVPGLMRGA